MSNEAIIEAANFHGETFNTFQTGDVPQPDHGTGEDYGSLLVRVSVDGYYGVDVTADLGRTATLDALDYMIRHLAALRTQRADLYGDRARPGSASRPVTGAGAPTTLATTTGGTPSQLSSYGKGSGLTSVRARRADRSSRSHPPTRSDRPRSLDRGRFTRYVLCSERSLPSMPFPQ